MKSSKKEQWDALRGKEQQTFDEQDQKVLRELLEKRLNDREAAQRELRLAKERVQLLRRRLREAEWNVSSAFTAIQQQQRRLEMTRLLEADLERERERDGRLA